MNLKEFNEVSANYQKLANLLPSIYTKIGLLSSEITEIYPIVLQIGDKEKEKKFEEKHNKATLLIEEIRTAILDNRLKELVNKELERLGNIDLANKPSTLEVRNNDE